MKILLISYGDYDYDGRLRELCDVFSSIGDLYAFTRGSVLFGERHTLCNSNYISFIFSAVAFGRKLGTADILVLDNRKSIIPGLLLKSKLHPRKIIQDCRELYERKEVSHLAGKIGCIIEKIGISKSDIIICANEFRGTYMQQMFHLAEPPIVYENLRRLKYSESVSFSDLEAKFEKYMHEGEIRIVSSSGCSLSRMNDVLVRNMAYVDHSCRLFLVGSSSNEDIEYIRKIIDEEYFHHIEILGQLNQDELKYLLSKSHIGIVNYHQKDLNNKFCASGKVYEFLYEGLPVVTTTNPPLTAFNDRYGIGVSDDTFCNGINQVIADYDRYAEAVKQFTKEHTVEDNNDALKSDLKKRFV